MRELKETIDLMLSGDYKERFVAEYWQTKIRYEKLKDFCDKIEAGEKTGSDKIPKHDCPLELLKDQQRFMGRLLRVYEIRAIIEGIDLQKPIVSNDTVFEN